VFPPELFVISGLNVFVILSLLTAIFDEIFPKAVPYVLQIAALAGFGQMWVNYSFLSSSPEMRFWCGMLYLTIALATVLAVNFYIAFKKRLLSAAGFFLGAFTIPVTSVSYFFVSSYVNGVAVSIPPLPMVPVEGLYIVFVLCIVILGLSVIMYYEPNALKRMLKMNRKNQNTVRLLDSTISVPRDDSEENKKKKRR
jgi:hypothetical protein